MMKDMIDKRNERERIARSIIKYWNVNYIPRTQADSGMQKQTAEAENAQDQTMDPNMHDFAGTIRQRTHIRVNMVRRKT